MQVPLSPPPATDGALLAGAFADFIAASARLEVSYRDLQAEVAELSQALVERNRALSLSRSENESLGHRLQRILEVIPCGVLVVDEEGTIQLANAEAARLLALDSESGAVPQLSLALVPTEIVTSAGDLQEQELALETAEGRRWVAVRRVSLPASAAPMASRRAEAVLTIRDISARKRLEREREAAREAVALAQVSALLAHEIRNPLASLELFAGLLQDQPERQADWVSHLRAGIRSLSGTVDNVLALHSQTHLYPEDVELDVESALAVSFLQPMAERSAIQLTLAAVPSSRRARANRNAVRQILLNLCSNALRHTPAGGRVLVRCEAPRRDGAPFRISVADTGSGIAPEHLPRLFEVGFSGSGTTSGLGLAVCQRLVQQLGGALHADSRVGHGSTFTLELAQA